MDRKFPELFLFDDVLFFTGDENLDEVRKNTEEFWHNAGLGIQTMKYMSHMFVQDEPPFLSQHSLNVLLFDTFDSKTSNLTSALSSPLTSWNTNKISWSRDSCSQMVNEPNTADN